MHLQPVFEMISQRQGVTVSASPFTVGRNETIPCRAVGGNIAEHLFAQGLCLPSGTAMTAADMERIIDVINRTHQNAVHRTS